MAECTQRLAQAEVARLQQPAVHLQGAANPAPAQPSAHVASTSLGPRGRWASSSRLPHSLRNLQAAGEGKNQMRTVSGR